MSTKIIKLSIIGGITLSAFMPLQSVVAWGPERPTYTNEHPADHATFNSITNNVSLGDERDFVRIAEIGGGGDTYTSDLEIKPGKQYEVYIYYHNDASTTFDDKAHNYAGVARETWLATRFPSSVNPGEKGEISAVLSWQNFDLSDGNPGKIWDEAYVTAKEKVNLSYVEGTAKIHNSWASNNTVLSNNLFNDGTYLGLDKLDGMILGCAEFSGNVTYTLQATGEDIPPTPPPGPEPQPEPEPTPPEPEPYIPSNPSTPSEIPNTGPVEVIIATVIVLAILGGGFYWLTTRKHLQKTTRAAARSRAKTPARRRTTTRRSPVKRSAVKRASRKRAVKKVVRKRK